MLGKWNRRMSTAMVRCHSSVNDLMAPLVKKNEKKIRRNIKVSAPTSAKICCVSWQDAFTEKVEQALFVGSEDDIYKWFISVSGAVVRELFQ